MAIVENHHREATKYRAQVRAMLERGELILPGQMEGYASLQDEAGHDF